MRPARVNFMGIGVDPVTLDQAVEIVADLVVAGGTHEQVSLNAGKVVACADDPEVLAMVRGCDLICADGAGVLLASRLLGVPLPERVAGIDLFLALIARAEIDGWRPFLLGATQEVVEAAAEALQQRHPRLHIAGLRDGYFGRDEEQQVAEQIAASGADLLFVALPSPRKEHFIARWSEQFGVAYVQGVGGSFDVVAGKTTRAPVWLQRAHLEWAWRWGQEPLRMWRRNVVGSSRFVGKVLRARLAGYTLAPTREAT